MTQILKLDIAGIPQGWISPEQATCYYATNAVVWTLGDPFVVMRGGYNRPMGRMSRIELHPIVAVRGTSRHRYEEKTPTLTNRKLFRRDRHLCAYCTQRFDEAHLTRDHVVPTSRGGQDRWENVLSACRSCNVRKGARLVSECGMEPVFLPYVPSRHEDLILQNRRIVADQMAFLEVSLPRGSRVRVV